MYRSNFTRHLLDNKHGYQLNSFLTRNIITCINHTSYGIIYKSDRDRD